MGMRAIAMATRVGWGAAMFAFPRRSNRLFGTPENPYLTRAFAAREALIGAGWFAADEDARGRWYLAALGGDIADGVAAAIALRTGELDRRVATKMVAASAISFGLGALARR